MPDLQMSNAEECLLLLLKNALHKDSVKVTPFAWDDVIRESASQTVDGLALSGAEECDVPEEFLEIWRDFVVKRVRENLQIHAGHTAVHRIFTEHKIPYCILKGSASAWYYPEPELRCMGDVDFLVAPEDVNRASQALKDNGFRLSEIDNEKHLVFFGDDVHLEMHHTLPGMPNGKNGGILKSYIKDIFITASVAECPAGEFCTPDKFHHGIVLILHTYHHWLGEGIGLRHLCDMALWIDAFSDAEFTELFREKLSKVGLWRFVQVLGQVCHKYLGIAYHGWMGEIEEELCFQLVQDIFHGGNFGRKSENRGYQGMMISDRGKDGIGKNPVLQTIKTANREAYYEFPVLQSVKIAKPFGWVLLGGRYLFRTVTGKRKKVSWKSVAQDAEKRKKIYRQLRIFEDEEE